MVVGICRRLRCGEGLTANYRKIRPLILLPNSRLSLEDQMWQRNECKSPDVDIIILKHHSRGNHNGGGVPRVGSVEPGCNSPPHHGRTKDTHLCFKPVVRHPAGAVPARHGVRLSPAPAGLSLKQENGSV